MSLSVRTDRQTDMTKLIIPLFQFWGSTWKCGVLKTAQSQSYLHFIQCKLFDILSVWDPLLANGFKTNLQEIMVLMCTFNIISPEWILHAFSCIIIVINHEVWHGSVNVKDEDALFGSTCQVISLSNCLLRAYVYTQIGEGLPFVRGTQQWLNYSSSASPSFWLDSFFRPVSK